MSDTRDPGSPPEDGEVRAVERTGAHEPLNPAAETAADERPRERPDVPFLDLEESDDTSTGEPATEPDEGDELDLPTQAEARPDLVAAAEAAALLSPEEAAALQAVVPADGERTAAFEPPRSLFASIPDPEDEPEPQSLVLGNVPESERPKFQQAATEFLPAQRPVPQVVAPAKPRVIEVKPPPEAPPQAKPVRKAPPTPPPERSEPSIILNLKSEDFDEEDNAKTNVFEAPEHVSDALPRGRLVVEGGEFAGKTWYLNRARTQIGRGTDNDIVLLDIAVSREHARLDRHRDGFRLVDLDSGNGSYVNGRRVTRCELYDGDQIEFGELCVVFSTIGEPRVRKDSQPSKITDPSIVMTPAAPARRFPMGWMLVWIAVTFLAVFGALVVTRRLTRQEPGEAAADMSTQARTWYTRAEQAASRRDWAVARQNVAVARKLAPELLPYDPLVTRIETAIAHDRAVRTARAQIVAKDPKSALATLAAIPAESEYAKDVAAAAKEAREALVGQLQKAAESALERGENDAAKQAAMALLGVEPEHERARAILAAIAEQGPKAPDAPKPEADAPAPDGPRAAPHVDAGVTAKPSPEDALVERAKREMSAGLRHYRRGRYADAIVAYERAAGRKVDRKLRKLARRNAKTVQDFARAWEKGRTAAEARKFSTATRPLEEARALDRRLGGYHRSKITEHLVSSYYFMAVRALSGQRFGEAARYNRKVLKLEPKHELGGKLAAKLASDATKLLQKAQKASGARRERLAKMVMEMTSPGAPTHEAAKALLPGR